MIFLIFTDLLLSAKELQNLVLVEIKKLLQCNNRSLRDFPSMTQPYMTLLDNTENPLIHDELNYDRVALAVEHERLVSSMTDEQRHFSTKYCGM